MTRSVGIETFPRARHVLRRSIEQANSRVTIPPLILPGHQAIAGSLMPPSQVLPLPSNNSPADPPAICLLSHGPLSLVKNKKVLEASLSRRKASITRPTLQSSSSTTSPYKPRALVPLNFPEANNGTCG